MGICGSSEHISEAKIKEAKADILPQIRDAAVNPDKFIDKVMAVRQSLAGGDK